MSFEPNYRKIVRFIGSIYAFWLIIVIFAANAIWIALSMAYPGQFDESYHLGIISLYAKQWSPFFFHQPKGPALYGALTRDPSYLYHYLMSFPDRLINLFSSDLHIQVVLLRLLNIVLFAVSLVIFKRLLSKTKASPALINMVLLFFVLIPVVPLLAAQINYDNLIMVMTAGLLLLTVKFQENLSHQRFNSALLLIALSIGMLGCLTQYLFMPIFAAMIIYLVYIIYRYIRTQPDYKITTLIKKDFQSMKKSVLIGSLAFFIVSGSLFVEMYAVNLVLYKNPVPACNQVLSTKDCLNYYAFERNYEVEAVKVKINSNPVIYSAHWAYRLFEFTFYTVSGGSSPLASYPFAAPLPGISLSAIGLFCFGSLLLIKYLRSLLREYPHVGFMLYVAIFFIAALWYRNYSDFLQIGQRVGINGRYLIPVMLAIALAFKRLLKQRPLTKTILLVAVLLLFLQGGGALTFIDASSSYWYWPNNSSVNKFNRQTQKIIRPLIYHHNLYRIGKNLYD